MLELKFKTIVNKLGISANNIYTSFRYCKDNYVGTITIKSSNLFILKEFRYENKKALTHFPCRSCNQRIVVLLESPHRSEFMLNLVAPALEDTGKKLNSFLPSLLSNNHMLSNFDTEIFLVNAIPFQCSLGFDTNVYRDQVLKAILGNKRSKKALKRRLKRINPDIVINAATAIKLKKSSTLKSYITQLLKQWNYKVYEASSHPCKWDKNTTLTKK